LVGSLLALACGILIPAQTRLNGELGAQLRDGYVAALLSFGAGLVIIVVVVLLRPRDRAALGRLAGTIRHGELHQLQHLIQCSVSDARRCDGQEARPGWWFSLLS